MIYRLLYPLIALATLVFVVYWLIGFDTTESGADAPLLTDVVIVVSMIYVAVAIIATLWAAVRTFRTRQRQTHSNGIAIRRMHFVLVAVVIVLLLVSYLATPTTPLQVNGEPYTEVLPLRLSGMFVVTAAVLIVMAVAATMITLFSRRRR